ncbi:hypothetical protein ACJX0J_021379, partial [Zea mays]
DLYMVVSGLLPQQNIDEYSNFYFTIHVYIRANTSSIYFPRNCHASIVLEEDQFNLYLHHKLTKLEALVSINFLNWGITPFLDNLAPQKYNSSSNKLKYIDYDAV